MNNEQQERINQLESMVLYLRKKLDDLTFKVGEMDSRLKGKATPRDELNDFGYFIHDQGSGVEKVSHWMPLPEHPNEEE